MQFPVDIDLLGLRLHPHPTFEALGYAVGLYLILKLRSRHGDRIPNNTRWWVIAGAMVGGALGSKALYWFEDPAALRAHWTDLTFLMAGKTVVGGLLGGLIGVEIVKRLLGEHRSTGDLLAVPLAVGIAIGRIGCFLTGLPDRTYGNPTSLPWGVDFGDGVARHPTQLYEIVFLANLAAVLTRMTPRHEGDVFKAFMVAYLAFRLVIDLLKPDVRIALGLSAIQWACVAGLLYYARTLLKSRATKVEASV
jgi:phosphatidylglycerol---prolipoprotein diacylglyceryl transferase